MQNKPKKPQTTSKDKRESTPKKPKNDQEKTVLESMRRFLRRQGERTLTQYPNATSIGIGYKQRQGKQTGEIAVQFTVEKKYAPEVLATESLELIPEEIEFEGMKFKTDVVARKFRPGYSIVETVPKKPYGKSRMGVVQPGASIANIKLTAGTLGAIVQDAATGEPVILSNWHVLHGASGKLGDQIAQPGPYDDNRVEENIIGTLLRSHLGIAGDCAICSISGRGFNATPFGINTTVRKIGRPDLGDAVVKSGRTTGVTYGRVSRIDALFKMPYEGIENPVTISGFEIESHPGFPAKDNEISRPGDSGSVWYAVEEGNSGQPTDIMLGLHFGGDAEHTNTEFALACYPESVFEKLELAPLEASPHDIESQRLSGIKKLQKGFDTDFLDFQVPFPTFDQVTNDDLAILSGKANIDYTHFTVWLSKSRKLPRCVAWNINGDLKKSLPRKGIPFVKDTRGDLAQYQWGDELYSNNALDRGHVARRDDLVWGKTKAEASQANIDSFYFTNMTPQHQAFNQSNLQGKWGLLENAILEDVTLAKLRVSLMGGPILADDDPLYRKAQIPREFWKIVCFKDDVTSEEKVRAFILTQEDLIGTLTPEALELDEFRWYQVPLSRIEEKVGVIFDQELHQREGAQIQALGAPQARLITDDFKGAFI